MENLSQGDQNTPPPGSGSLDVFGKNAPPQKHNQCEGYQGDQGNRGIHQGDQGDQGNQEDQGKTVVPFNSKYNSSIYHRFISEYLKGIEKQVMIMAAKKDKWQRDSQVEKEFNESVLEENSELLEQLTNQAQAYIWEGRPDKFSLLLKATSNIMTQAQTRMTETLGIDAASLN